MTFIKTTQYEDATGRLKSIYDEIINKRGKLAEVHKIQSLRPESIIKHMDLYMEIMFSKSALSRAEREIMAVITSVSNNCQYCQIHHADALNNYWKNTNRTEKLINNYYDAQLTEKELLLCQFAENLTLQPADLKKPVLINKLKEIGFSDAAILDATLVVAYFNFVNRIVVTLGVEIENKEERNYKY